MVDTCLQYTFSRTLGMLCESVFRYVSNLEAIMGWQPAICVISLLRDDRWSTTPCVDAYMSRPYINLRDKLSMHVQYKKQDAKTRNNPRVGTDLLDRYSESKLEHALHDVTAV